METLKKIIVFLSSLLFILLFVNIPSYAQDSRIGGGNRSSNSSNMVDPVIIAALISAVISAGVAIFSLLRNEKTAHLSRKHEDRLAELKGDLDRLVANMTDARERELAKVTDARERELAKGEREHREKLAKWKAEREDELAEANRADDLMMEQWRYEHEQKREEQKARREYELEARKRLYKESEPILFQLHQLCEAADSRISHMPRKVREGWFLTKEEYLKAIEKYEEKSPTQQKEEEEVLMDRFGWLSFPNHYMFTTIYRLLAPMATFKMLQDRLTTVDLELDPLIKTIYLLSKHLYYRTFSGESELAEIANIPYETYDQGIFLGYLENATEELIQHYNEPDKVQRIKSFGEFNKNYIIEENSTGNNEKKVKPPFDRFYYLFEFFHPKTKPVLWRLLIEQVYLYNAIKEVYKIKESDNYYDRIEKQKKIKPIRRIPKDQLHNFDYTDQSFIDVEKHLLSHPELTDLIDDEIKRSHASTKIQPNGIFFE
jgi:hypothetical protein